MSLPKNGRTILIGEDDLDVRSYLETALKCQGYSVEMAQDGDEVLDYLRRGEPQISAVLLDIVMPQRDGIDALKEIRCIDRDLPVIMTSGASSAANIVEAMKHGATDFMAKPIKPDDLRKALSAVFSAKSVAPPVPSEQAATANKQISYGISRQMRDIKKLSEQIARSDAPVLIQGETGVGKEVLARDLHAHSLRAKKAFLKLNCAALPSELVESELFGYERGAFTGAFQKKPGMFERADGGTIMLDEIGDMDVKLQAKLLQVLQDQEFNRLGGKDPVRVDVRVIAATHRNLEQAIAEKTFREDLYYRLNVISIEVPPLRERKEDILPIAETLLRKHTAPGLAPVQLGLSLKQALIAYDWPGNIRQLENTIRKLLVIQDSESIERELRSRMNTDPTEEGPAAAPANAELSNVPVLEQLAKTKSDAERNTILSVLKTTNWNRRQAAVLLHIDYKALLYKMKRLCIKEEKPTFISRPRAEAAPRSLRSSA